MLIAQQDEGWNINLASLSHCGRIRKIVIQEGTCGNFQPKTCYPTKFPPLADSLLKDNGSHKKISYQKNFGKKFSN